MAFEQATIKVVNEPQFAQLQNAVRQAFVSAAVEKFLKRLDRKGIRVRDFDAVLAAKALEDVAGTEAGSAQKLYASLPLSDQAQMREFYLSQLESVDQALRHKFKKLYQYY
jgi:hypothetical protein